MTKLSTSHVAFRPLSWTAPPAVARGVRSGPGRRRVRSRRPGRLPQQRPVPDESARGQHEPRGPGGEPRPVADRPGQDLRREPSVKRVEQALHRRGLLAKQSVDGYFGTATIKAWGKFERNQKQTSRWTRNGLPGLAELQALGKGRFRLTNTIDVGRKSRSSPLPPAATPTTAPTSSTQRTQSMFLEAQKNMKSQRQEGLGHDHRPGRLLRRGLRGRLRRHPQRRRRDRHPDLGHRQRRASTTGCRAQARRLRRLVPAVGRQRAHPRHRDQRLPDDLGAPRRRTPPPRASSPATAATARSTSGSSTSTA